MHHAHVHAAVEVTHKIAERTDKTIQTAESAGQVARVISASHAFRKCDWLGRVPVRNAKGTLQGMVLSSRWRAAYNISVRYGEFLERYHLGSFATVAAGIAASSDQIVSVLESGDSWGVKGARLSTQAT